MTTTIHMRCDGCDAQHEVRIKRTFQSFNGRGYGFGSWHVPSIDDVTEDSKWVWADPYTSCTYCPECWSKIENGEAA